MTAEKVSQQLSRVEELYRGRMEALQRECTDKLAAQDAASQKRLAEARDAADKALAKVRRAALHEVQRAEAFLESKAQVSLRLLDQLGKRCAALEARVADMRPLAEAAQAARDRAQELELRLWEAQDAAEAAAAEVAAASRCGTAAVGIEAAAAEANTAAAEASKRLAALRGELVEQAGHGAALQSDLAAAQAARLAAEERLEEAEATCRALRDENAGLREQLLEAALAPGGVGAGGGAGGRVARVEAGGSMGPAVADELWRANLRDAASRASAEAAALREKEAAAQAAALAAAQADASSREALAAARREQVASSRALLAQLRRVQALEAMRLRDLQDIHALERRLGSAL
ncbi:hypothetical protein HYH03_007315 [Edaphochlamys debaryana]|uniref:Uncharacterized protein n=1 Tax=Edaphochlamys debaryana TaxID=47281 RepID=A0A836C0J1_9CHLO|nr:hypothetical protein HYH03_007315 [Edaphochlamys debaryana]|eukprot:KAG2494548.1 hypothetical protein HYH03_007315 [Edaphochlamys debaryana]